MDKITLPSVTFIAASPKCGKTHFISSFILKQCLAGKFNHGLLFFGTKNINVKDYQWMPEEHVHGEYSEDVLKRFLLLQREHKAPAFLIFDDMIGKMKFDGQLIEHLFTTFRHYNLTIFVAVQYLNKVVPPTIRSNAENFIVFKQPQVICARNIKLACMGEFKNDTECMKFIDTHCPNISDHKYILVRPFEESKNKYIVGKAPGQLPNIRLEF
jgi:hypothetical protein